MLTRELNENFAIFVYTFGTRSYGLEVIHQIDPEEKYLKVGAGDPEKQTSLQERLQAAP